jgi:FkbM family methyltransferase
MTDFTMPPIYGKGDLCFDIGAHCGDYTDWMLRNGARFVVAVEPQVLHANAMRARFANMAGNAAIICAAASDHIGTGSLHVCRQVDTIYSLESSWTRGRFSGYDWYTTVPVPLVTLDALIGEYGTPDYIKIDVEGHEHAVVAGLSQPIKVIVFEFAKEVLDNTWLAMQRLYKLGNYRYACSLGDSNFDDRWYDRHELIDRLRADPNTNLWGNIYAYLITGIQQ